MIIVAGMHRSGTSLTAQILQSLGADFGPADELWEADQWNANGYLERRDVIDINSRAITGFARTNNRGVAAASQLAYLRMPTALQIRKRATTNAALLGEVHSALTGYAVKDPRFCLTMPAWLAAGDVDAVVVALRHPSASVASLAKRNRMPKPLGYKFWAWHMRELLAVAPTDAIVVRQDELLGPNPGPSIDRLEAAAALVQGPLTGEHPAVGDPRSLLDPSMVHHQPDESGLPADVRALWEQWIARAEPAN